LIGLLVLNTGTQTLGYTPDGANRYFLIVLALTFINQAVNSAYKKRKITKLLLKENNYEYKNTQAENYHTIDRAYFQL
jgi:hypothetical protein